MNFNNSPLKSIKIKIILACPKSSKKEDKNPDLVATDGFQSDDGKRGLVLVIIFGLFNRKWLTPSSGNAYETNERVPRSTIDDLYKDWVSKIIIITVVFHALNQDLLY